MSNRCLLPACIRCLATMCLIGLLATGGKAADSYAENPGAEGDGKYTIGPDYKIDPDLTDRGNPKGKSFEFTMRLADSKIFRGDDSTLEPEKKAVRKERKIFVYVPATYHDGAKAPILIIHDGPGQLKLVRNALDNLTISKDPNRKLPAFIPGADSPTISSPRFLRLQSERKWKPEISNCDLGDYCPELSYSCFSKAKPTVFTH